MTKTEFTKQLLALVDNGREDGTDDLELIGSIEAFLGVVQPVDRKSFASWGYPEHRSTPDTCWPLEV